jgi:hypothetical protein
MRTVLIDREGHHPEGVQRLPDLWGLATALGLD